MIGAFYQPLAVVADVDVLATLPQRELVAGLAEVIKYGAVADDAFLAWIEASLPALLGARQAGAGAGGDALVPDQGRSGRARRARSRACARSSTSATPSATRSRPAPGYGTWLHGEAVGCGMAMAADLSVRLGLIERAHAERIARHRRRRRPAGRAPALGVERYLELMRMDKKAAAGQLRFIVLEGPGRAAVRGVDAGRRSPRRSRRSAAEPAAVCEIVRQGSRSGAVRLAIPPVRRLGHACVFPAFYTSTPARGSP